ncbi:DUF3574 domain-containing protein [Saccharopolyspora rosea]|uniref:DUF3574 domain-containing protein n=1 Tax=Saccharopolyspora rosea TaxID=524884 RepID=A0ABW3FUK0_9PSEU|nr:DUF3574 domain-containing protein [Saccharopolyspora rosea]
MTGTRLAAAALAAGLVGVAAPAAWVALDQRPAESEPRAAGAPYVETTLLFGTQRPDGGAPVTDEQFHGFLDEVVTPLFPDGLTVEDAYGQYRDSHGRIERERSYRLTLLHPESEAPRDDARIDHVRKTYQQRFAQESVARVDERTRVDF